VRAEAGSGRKRNVKRGGGQRQEGGEWCVWWQVCSYAVQVCSAVATYVEW